MVRRLRVFAFICGSCLLAGLALAGAGAACELPPRQDPGKSRTVYRLDPGASVVRFDAKAFMHDFQGTSGFRGPSVWGTWTGLQTQRHASESMPPVWRRATAPATAPCGTRTWKRGNSPPLISS
jgi:hypothetical protein